MKRLNICIDIDGTITDPYCYLEHFNQHFNQNIAPEDFNHHRLDVVYKASKDDMIDFYKKNGSYMYLSATVQKFAKEILWELIEQHNIFFVTARLKDSHSTTQEWMKKNGLPNVPLYSLGSHYKVDKAKELNCDIFLEDNPKIALELVEAGINVVLIDTHYNKYISHPKIKRVFNWKEAFDFIKNFK